MAKTLAEYMIDRLVAAGVERIYGIVGDSLNPVTDAIRRSGKIHWMHVRHEETGGLRGRSRGSADRPTGGLRRQLRPRQPAPDQRTVRRTPQHGARAGHRRSHSQLRNRHRLFPGDASRSVVSRVQPLLRAHLQSRPDAARAAIGHATRRQQAGVAVIVLVGRRGGNGRPVEGFRPRHRHRAARWCGPRRRSGAPGRSAQQGAAE